MVVPALFVVDLSRPANATGQSDLATMACLMQDIEPDGFPVGW
ncbi:hypothetical protein AU152_gp01 [Mycobacterium phage Phlei]|uniref:Ig-like domain-containing protein n=1 Tax=Mycobacterium phage Phlei TaxID=1690684 RepID=A0A0N9BDL9_9CAUD|nr:hypothetical protein AU152_gp01 [Mycobacterium phage Phlei]ALA48114.1 hypothetical protein [Mycobacterium phage Phlei]